MKVYTVLAVALSVFFSVLTCVVYNSVNEKQQAPFTSDESGIQDLVRRLDSIQVRLDGLAATVGKHPRVETSSAVVVPVENDSSLGAGDRKKSDRKPPAESATSTGERLAALLDLKGGEEDVRQYVTGIIEDDRRFQKKLQRQKQTERRALFKGPYGRHNFQVNSLAWKLDLGDGQKEKYHELLQHYGKEVEILHKGKDGKSFWETGNPEQIAAHVKNMEQQRKNLGEQLGNDFVQFLDEDQAQAYLDLPDSQRGLGGGAGVFHHVEVGENGSSSVQLHIETSNGIGFGDLPEVLIPPIEINPTESPGNEDE